MLRVIVRFAAATLAIALAVGPFDLPARAAVATTARASFGSLVASAQSSAAAERPDEALSFYSLAFQAAGGNDTRQRVALFGMGRMLAWLGRCVESENVYRRLLATDLGAEDRDVALTGLVKSVACEGRPMEAYAIGSSTHATRNPELAIATAQAAAYAGWPDKADSFLSQSAPALDGIVANSRLATALRSVRRELGNDLGPLVTLGYEGSSDSDGLRIGSTSVGVNMRAGRATIAQVSFDRVTLSQNTWDVAGTLASVGASSRLGDRAWIAASLGSQTYPGWQTGIYHSSVSYRPNDLYGFRASVEREVVQSQVALARHITSSLGDISGDTTLGTRSTLTAAAYRQNFSDGNARMGISGKIGAVIADAAGLSGYLRWRSFSDSVPGSAAYFDPQRYGTFDAWLTESRRIGTDWRISMSGGVGRQYVNPGGSSTAASYEAAVNGYTRGCIGARATFGYSNSALAANSGYQRHYASILLSCKL
jgi:hypothetical protein